MSIWNRIKAKPIVQETKKKKINQRKKKETIDLNIDGFGGGHISSSNFLLSSSWIRLLLPRQISRPSWDPHKSSGVRRSCSTSRCSHLNHLLSAVVSSYQARQLTQCLIFYLSISLSLPLSRKMIWFDLLSAAVTFLICVFSYALICCVNKRALVPSGLSEFVYTWFFKETDIWEVSVTSSMSERWCFTSTKIPAPN